MVMAKKLLGHAHNARIFIVLNAEKKENRVLNVRKAIMLTQQKAKKKQFVFNAQREMQSIPKHLATVHHEFLSLGYAFLYDGIVQKITQLHELEKLNRTVRLVYLDIF